LNAYIAVSDTTGKSAQLIKVIVDVVLKKGYHIYAKPIPDGYIPMSVELEANSNFSMDEIKYPSTKTLEMKSIKETFHILPEKFKLLTDIRIKTRPKMGDYSLNFTIKFQACDDSKCEIPEELNFTFPLKLSR